MHSLLRGKPWVRKIWTHQFDLGYAYGKAVQTGMLPQNTRMSWSLLCLPYRRGWATAELIYEVQDRDRD